MELQKRGTFHATLKMVRVLKPVHEEGRGKKNVPLGVPKAVTGTSILANISYRYLKLSPSLFSPYLLIYISKII